MVNKKMKQPKLLLYQKIIIKIKIINLKKIDKSSSTVVFSLKSKHKLEINDSKNKSESKSKEKKTNKSH